MKKLNLLLLAFVALFVISCNSTPEVEEEENVTEEVVEPEVETTTEVSVELPTFENEEFNTFAQDMDALMNKTIALLKAGDQEGLAALEEEGKALQARGEALKDKITVTDTELFESYMKGKAAELMSAAGIDLNAVEDNSEISAEH